MTKKTTARGKLIWRNYNRHRNCKKELEEKVADKIGGEESPDALASECACILICEVL